MSGVNALSVLQLKNMINQALAAPLAVTLLILWYAVGSIQIIKRRGLDPTLVTYLTPLSVGGFTVARVMMALLIVAQLGGDRVHLFNLVVALTLLGFAGLQAVLLTVFARSGTQPFGYYILLTLCAAFAIPKLPSLLQAATLILLLAFQELVLRDWMKKRTDYYNRWVAKKVTRIHQTHYPLASELTDEEWFYTLHFAVTESIARPRLSRIMERVYFYLKRPAKISSGLMQVQSDKLLSDKESLEQGSRIVRELLHTMPRQVTSPTEQLKWLAREYNGSLNEAANEDYAGYLLSTYPGLLAAWQKIDEKSF